MGKKEGLRLVAQNRKARHDYEILDTLEAGIVLMGSEVKSIRDGNIQLRDSFARIENGEVWLYNVHIKLYPNASMFDKPDPDRKRKLLMNNKEIAKWFKETDQKPNSIIPLGVYFKDGKAKVELALARGKKAYDKRQSIAKRDAARDTEREFANQRKRR